MVYNIILTRPNNAEACEIWMECGLRPSETVFVVEQTLWVWAVARGHVYGVEGETHIAWTSKSGVRHMAKWPAFQRWFILCCGRLLPEPPPSLTPPQE